MLIGVLLMSGLVSATPNAVTVDGTKAVAEGYATLAIQDTQTGFADNSDGSVDYANGSELDGLYIVDDGDFFSLFIAGNIETNFNKLELFFDYEDGGQQTLRNDNPDVDFNGLNAMAGLQFDTGFAADYWIMVTTGNFPTEIYANYANLETNGGGTGGAIGGGTGLSIDGTMPDIDVALDNSNTAGVEGGTGTAAGNAAAVNTGIEIKIAKAALGIVNGARATDLKIVAFINAGNHGFLSNQVLPGIGGGTNIGGPGDANFNNYAGDQFAQIEVTSVALSSQVAFSQPLGLLWLTVGLSLLTVGTLRRHNHNISR